MFNKVTGVIFSPTANTKKYVNSALDAVKLPTELIDLTTTFEPLKRIFSEDELLILGAPVYSGRIPNVARHRFSELRGNNTKCILVASYGNRHYDDALIEMKDLMTENGFEVVGACAVIGKHTYGNIQVDRPDENDFTEMKNFIHNVINKGDNTEFDIPGSHPYKEGGSGGKFKPLTADNCIKCGKCVKSCPVGAIADDCRTIDKDKCLSCFRCINICPVHAKNSDTDEYNTFAVNFTERLKQRRENEFYL